MVQHMYRSTQNCTLVGYSNLTSSQFFLYFTVSLIPDVRNVSDRVKIPKKYLSISCFTLTSLLKRRLTFKLPTSYPHSIRTQDKPEIIITITITITITMTMTMMMMAMKMKIKTSISFRGEQKYSQSLHATETRISSGLLSLLACMQTFSPCTARKITLYHVPKPLLPRHEVSSVG